LFDYIYCLYFIIKHLAFEKKTQCVFLGIRTTLQTRVSVRWLSKFTVLPDVTLRSLLYPEDRSIILFRNVDIFLGAYTASQTRETVIFHSKHLLFVEVSGYTRLKAKRLVLRMQSRYALQLWLLIVRNWTDWACHFVRVPGTWLRLGDAVTLLAQGSGRSESVSHNNGVRYRRRWVRKGSLSRFKLSTPAALH